jgi:hypothetical protein
MVEVQAQLQHPLTQHSVRPPRAVTLICPDDGWRADALRMLECYSRTWGGDGNGLTACSDTGEIPEPFWALLRALDPDHWVYFQRTRRGLRLADPATYQELLARDVARFVADGWTEDRARELLESDDHLSGHGNGPIPTALDQRIRRRFAPLASPHVAIRGSYKADEPPPPGLVDMCQLTYRPDQTAALDAGQWPLSIQLLLATRTGILGPAHRAHLEASGGWAEETILAEDGDLPDAVEMAWTGQVDQIHKWISDGASSSRDPDFGAGDFPGRTPLPQSRLGCKWLVKLRRQIDEEPAVVICGDTAEDFCYAFTRQRVTGNTYWLPVGPAVRDLEPVLRETLARVLSSSYAQTPAHNRTVLLSSLTLPAADLTSLLGELTRTVWGHDFNSGRAGSLNIRICAPTDLAAVRDLVLLDQEHFAHIRHEPFLGPDQAGNLEILRPSVAAGESADSCRWQVDVLMPDHVLPARWCLDTIISDQRAHWTARSSTSGISVDSHGRIFQFTGSPLSQMLAQVRLRFPPAREVFAALLGDAGTLHESDKGRYARRMIELWEGLPALAADLQSAPTRWLLAAWASETVNGDLGRIHQGRKYLRLQDVMKITRLRVGQARDLLDGYLARNVAARGLVLRCALCAGTAFYRLEDLGHGFRCQRCRQENRITSGAWTGAREPQWFYGLDEVVFQALAANAQVPVLALASLARDTRSFLYMNEVVVRAPGRNDLEVDLWAIADGQILIGEAKKSDKLVKTAKDERARCNALRALATAITADQFVMATSSGQWSQRTRDSATTMIGPAVPIRWIEGLDEQRA